MLYTHEISDPETFVRREARADVLMLSSCESILPRLALSQEQKRKIQTLEINVPPHSRREKPAPDGLPIKFRSINTKNQSDTFLIRNDPVLARILYYLSRHYLSRGSRPRASPVLHDCPNTERRG